MKSTSIIRSGGSLRPVRRPASRFRGNSPDRLRTTIPGFTTTKAGTTTQYWDGLSRPDTVISDYSNPQSYNRYAYVLNNPLCYTDPTGHGFWSNFKPSLLWDRQVYAGIGYSIMGNTSVRQDPNSYQALMANSGTPLLSDLTDAQGNKLGNPALAVGKIVATAPVKAAMIIGGPAEEETLLSSAGKALESERALAVGRSSIRWVKENASMDRAASAYEKGALGAREGVAPALVGPAGNLVKFDGVEGNILIDRKIAVTTFPKAYYQAFRQSQALKANGFLGRWEVPTQAQADRAMAIFKRLGINNITVRVVPQ